MSDRFALEPVAADPAHARLAGLTARLADREDELAALKAELLQLQTRYLEEVGVLYAQLSQIEAAIADEGIRLGLRLPPPDEDEDEDDAAPASRGPAGSDGPDAPGCSNRSAPSDHLKAVFRNLAKSIHPDLASDEAARSHRHSLMAEANRAYAERDEDRLRLILRAWERSPGWQPDSDPGQERVRVDRRIAEAEARLLTIDLAFADLDASAIGQLRSKIADARRQGWDLFAEMVHEMKREIVRARARLAALLPRPRGR
jgi:hypothetical protein